MQPRGDTEALVLDSLPYAERHLLLSVLTAAHGVVRGIARGVRGGKAPAAAAAQILSLVRLEISYGPHAELATFRRLELVESSYPLAAELELFAAASAVAELLLTFCPPHEPAERAFRLGRTVLSGLLGGARPEVAVAYAAQWTLALAGLLPPLDACASCGAKVDPPFALRPTDGHPVCARCRPTDAGRLDRADVGFLAVVRRRPLEEVGDTLPPGVGAWLDQVVHAVAERRLPALDFFRIHGGGRG
jgi:DNA repair protein RecO (recombination protein O)